MTHPQTTTVLLLLLLTTAASKTTIPDDDDDDDQDSYPYDPLQPIWDRLDKIPEALEAILKSRIDSLFDRTQNEIEKLKTKMAEMEGRLAGALAQSQHDVKERIGHKLTSSEARVREDVSNLLTVTVRNALRLRKVGSGVRNISDALGPLGEMADDVASCIAAASVNKSEAPREDRNASTSSCSVDVEWVRELESAVDRLREAPGFLPKDCSDHHWQRPQSPSGIYTTYPTMDAKTPVEAYCDMEGGGETGAGAGAWAGAGGWTVVNRRHNSTWGLTNFNRTWEEYRAGFGTPGEGEWWYGLASLHALTYRQPYELQILMHDIEQGFFQASYTTFRVESEGKNFGLVLEGFSGNVTTDALHLEHRGRPFSTYDRDHDNWREDSCAAVYSGGWWYSSCIYSTLTAPLAGPGDSSSAKVMRWVNMDTTNQVLLLDEVTMKIRPATYGNRFNPQPRDGE